MWTNRKATAADYNCSSPLMPPLAQCLRLHKTEATPLSVYSRKQLLPKSLPAELQLPSPTSPSPNSSGPELPPLSVPCYDPFPCSLLSPRKQPKLPASPSSRTKQPRPALHAELLSRLYSLHAELLSLPLHFTLRSERPPLPVAKPHARSPSLFPAESFPLQSKRAAAPSYPRPELSRTQPKPSLLLPHAPLRLQDSKNRTTPHSPFSLPNPSFSSLFRSHNS